MNAPVTPWNDARSYLPDPFEHLAAIEENKRLNAVKTEAWRHYRRIARKALLQRYAGIAVMVVVAVAIGFMLAVGHS